MLSANLLDEDLLLWNRFRNGDAEAFSALMRLHYQDLFNYGTRFSNDEELIKDCIQDMFLSLWEHKATVNEATFVKYYLVASLRRRLHKVLDRQKKQQAGLKERSMFSEAMNGEWKIILQEKDRELSKKIARALDKLSPRQQEVIYLKFYLEADVEDIAEIMLLHKQSVYNLLHDALKKLKSVFSTDSFLRSEFFNSMLFF